MQDVRKQKQVQSEYITDSPDGATTPRVANPLHPKYTYFVVRYQTGTLVYFRTLTKMLTPHWRDTIKEIQLIVDTKNLNTNPKVAELQDAILQKRIKVQQVSLEEYRAHCYDVVFLNY